ncbi:hypothetical protein J6590_094476 [Homalodisca vitripennis]|nr:hypothetical protein J6590_094476 [Homalodisca vitripennis]
MSNRCSALSLALQALNGTPQSEVTPHDVMFFVIRRCHVKNIFLNKSLFDWKLVSRDVVISIFGLTNMELYCTSGQVLTFKERTAEMGTIEGQFKIKIGEELKYWKFLLHRVFDQESSIAGCCL